MSSSSVHLYLHQFKSQMGLQQLEDQADQDLWTGGPWANSSVKASTFVAHTHPRYLNSHHHGRMRSDAARHPEHPPPKRPPVASNSHKTPSLRRRPSRRRATENNDAATMDTMILRFFDGTLIHRL